MQFSPNFAIAKFAFGQTLHSRSDSEASVQILQPTAKSGLKNSNPAGVAGL
jgi:hypothetical protein